MKPPPNTPEFSRFTRAMRDLLSVSKEELQLRLAAEKKRKQSKASASPSAASSSKMAH